MTPKLTQYLNRQILVSIPALFEDGRCRPFRLVGAEFNGLWLQSDELTRRLYPEKQGEAPVSLPAFVPFAQISAVLITPPALGAAPSTAPENKDSTAQGSAGKSKAGPAAAEVKAVAKGGAKAKAKPRK